MFSIIVRIVIISKWTEDGGMKNTLLILHPSVSYFFQHVLGIYCVSGIIRL